MLTTLPKYFQGLKLFLASHAMPTDITAYRDISLIRDLINKIGYGEPL